MKATSRQISQIPVIWPGQNGITTKSRVMDVGWSVAQRSGEVGKSDSTSHYENLSSTSSVQFHSRFAKSSSFDSFVIGFSFSTQQSLPTGR
jgi:hypothetical protein